MKLAAARASLCLAVLFLLVYGGTNWITAQRSDVGAWYFGWERAIPFVPLMIVPYMSIDLFFLVAPFLCKDRRELHSLSLRITFAIVVAGVCFLVWPLRFAFARPEAPGLLGELFAAFRLLDQPYNLAPSLHIALCVILAGFYAHHSHGWIRGLLSIWFVLIACSTLLTYQHHIVDIVGGFVLAGACCSLFPDVAEWPVGARNVRVGTYYGLGAAALFGLALVSQPWGSVLLWPSFALGITAAAYWGAGPGIFLKRAGRLPWWIRVLMSPVLVGQYLSLLYYRRRSQPWNIVHPGLMIGRKLSNREAEEASVNDLSAVLDLTAEFSEANPLLCKTYLNVPILDLTAPTAEQLQEAAQFIAQQASRGTVYVHCKVGYSRTAAVVGAYLMAAGRAATAQEAVEVLRRSRPGIVVRPEVWSALRSFEQAMQASPGDSPSPRVQ